MKNLYVIVFVLISLIGVQAQTVTQAFNEPSIGDVDKNYKLDTSAYTTGLPTAITGSNVTWDFTKVEGAFPVLFDSIVAPSAAAGNSDFPTATYAQKRGGINAFFKSSPSQTEWVGVYSPSLTITFTNSAIIATYPISYGYSSTDPVVGTFKYNTTTGVCNGSLNVTSDGIGTLNLPNNVSFQNVLKVRSVEQLTMTTGAFPVGKITQSIYSFYAPGKKYPVISVQYQKYELLVGTPTITAMAYGNFAYFTVAGINEFKTGERPDVFPNPFHDKLYVANTTSLIAEEITLYNIQGVKLANCRSIEELHVEDLPPAVYLLEIKTQRGSAFRKIIKE